ncbi:hypothetical protein DWY69_01905 [Eisenbergiella massiliensis]|uniref:Uncharacterized protein n=1 Tax=Eisenbergiella massiliensis TaxID=1720294 RepID=A0A3E3IAM8_9FIRM|nr:hypothetical protein DXC51_03185 [Eisenbergiella massiliensis]RGE73870.1 hypothetical protein DWY69_01905 [Eisenbergiella massiliensis]
METGNPDKEKIFQKLKIFTWEVIYVYDKSYMLILMCGTFWHQQTAAADRNGSIPVRRRCFLYVICYPA